MAQPGGNPYAEHPHEPNDPRHAQPGNFSAGLPGHPSEPTATSSFPAYDPAPAASDPAPASGVPYAAPPPFGLPPGGPMVGVQSHGRRSLATPILAAAAVLLFVAAGVMAALYVANNNTLTGTISKRDSTISAKNAELDRAKRDLQRASDELAKTRTDLTGSQNQADELARQKQLIIKCFRLLGEAGLAAEKGDRATFAKKQTEARTACTEADKYLE